MHSIAVKEFSWLAKKVLFRSTNFWDTFSDGPFSCDYSPQTDLLTVSMENNNDFKTTLFAFDIKTKQVLLEIDNMHNLNERYAKN